VRTTYRMLAYVIAATVALQAASVALAFFTILDEVDGGQIITADYDYEGNLGILVHRVGGLGIIPLAAIALLIVSFFTKGAGAVRWAGTVFGLVVLQIAFVFAAFGGAPSAGRAARAERARDVPRRAVGRPADRAGAGAG